MIWVGTQLDDEGFVHDSLADIATLRDVLATGYDQESILKELMQNADDAGATSLHLCWHPAWPDHTHPLLRCPLLFVLNDGKFDENDAKAIRIIRLGSKADNNQAIGRFGLGLKSVFRWCEAFYYLASENQPGVKSEKYQPFLNPWGRSGVHDEWNVKPPPIDPFIQFVEIWPVEAEQWFCLVLPVRSRDVLAGKEPIVPVFPSEHEVMSPDLVTRAAVNLTLLQRLSSLTLWKADGSTDIATKICTVTVDPESQRRMELGQQVSDSCRLLCGQVEVASDTPIHKTLYVGTERVSSAPSFMELRSDENWPKQNTVDQSGRSVTVHDKAIPHAAVVFHALEPSEQHEAKLHVAWSVFLPLTEGIQVLRYNGPSDVYLLLHGYFFLDSGRRRLYQGRDDLTGIESKWNRLLTDELLLPQVLPALQEFVRKADWSVDHIASLTAVLLDNNVLGRMSEYMCSRHQWLQCLTRSGSEWRLLASESPYMLLPLPDGNDLPVIYKALPALAGAVDRVALVCDDWPRATRKEPESWGTDGWWLQGINVSTLLSDTKQVDWFCLFLERNRKSFTHHVWSVLVDEIRKTLAGLENERNQPFLRELSRVLQYIPEQYWCVVEVPGLAPAILAMLNAGNDAPICIGSDLAPPQRKGGRLSGQGAKWLFECLEGQGDIGSHMRTRLAGAILRKTDGTHEDLRRVVGSVSVFRVYDCRSKQEVPVCWNELWQWRNEGRLFAQSELLRALQRAVPDTSLYRLVGDDVKGLASLLFGEDSVQECNKETACDVLATRPKLSVPEDRVELLRLLVHGLMRGDESRWNAIRYLLHGTPAAYESRATLLTDAKEDHWGSLAKRIIEHSQEQWRGVPRILTSTLNLEQLSALSVQIIEPDTVAAIISRDLSAVASIAPSLTEDETAKILRLPMDDTDWKRLPLHETLNGRRASIGKEHSYLIPAGMSVAPSLAPLITAVQTPTDDVLLARYRRLLPTWSPSAAIELACNQAQPERHWLAILDAVAKDSELSEEALHLLRTRPWLPTSHGVRPPSQVVHLPGHEDSLARLLTHPELRGTFVDVGQVDERIRQHVGYHTLVRLAFPNCEDAIDILSSGLRQVPDYYIGDLKLRFRELQRLIGGLGAVGSELLPGVALIREFVNDPALRSKEEVLLNALIGPISLERMLTLLRALADAHDDPHRSAKADILFAYNLYLEALARSADFSADHLRKLRLLNRAKEWTHPSLLCMDGLSLSEKHVLDEEQANILRDLVSIAGIRMEDASDRNTAHNAPDDDPKAEAAVLTPLADYLNSWRGIVPDPVIGGFLALLGDRPPGLLALAEQYLAPRSVRGVRDLLAWTPGTAQNSGRDIHEDMERTRFYIRVMDTAVCSTVRVANLFGEPLDVPLTDVCEHLLLGSEASFSLNAWAKHSGYPLTLRKVDTTSIERSKTLIMIIAETLRIILDKAFYQRPANLNNWLDELADTGQLDLKCAQAKILENAFFYFRQVSGGLPESLRKLTRQWNTTVDREVEARSNATLSRYREDILRERDQVRERLRNLLLNDATLQRDLLEAVRAKVKQYQYDVGSVLFELFQNADDAVVELIEMLGEDKCSSDVPAVAVSVNQGELRFMHSGRPVNVFRLGQCSASEGRNRGFHDDLFKMLVLQSSDKADGGDAVTGKFGLGFKSVLLVTERPRVLSGALGFEVVAGMFPIELSEDVRQDLNEACERYCGKSSVATVVSLPVSDTTVVEDAMKQFRLLAPIQVVFAKRVRRVSLESARLGRFTWEWSPREVSAKVHVGKLSMAGLVGASMALVLHGEPSGALLLLLDARGFKPIPKEIPTFWVTAPTDERLEVGIAVNGSFLPDAGRRRLPSDSVENCVVADRLAEDFGNALLELYDCCQSWDTFRSELRLADDCTVYMFWESLWSTLPKPGDLSGTATAAQLLRNILWREDRGVLRLLYNRDALPTGLPGEYRVLTALRKAKYVACGALDDEDTFLVVSQWPEFRGRVAVGSIISDARVLRHIGETISTSGISRLGLIDALHWAVPESNEVVPAVASYIGKVISPDFLRRYREDKDKGGNAERLEENLARLRFRANDGRYHNARELLIVDQPGDKSERNEEALRAAFAPDSHQLHRDYDVDGISFFRACRGRMVARPELLARWMESAVHDPDRWQHALTYLEQGELSEEVGRNLNTATRMVVRSEVLSDRTARGTTLAAAIGIPVQELRDPAREFPEHQCGPSRIDPQAMLDNIYQWWETEHKIQLREYERRVYPVGGCPLAKISKNYGRTSIERSAWLTLLLRGALETMGRPSWEAHRNFLEICSQEGWLDSFAADTPVPDDLVREVERYLDGQAQSIPYFQWIRYFVSLFLFARRLDDYILSLLAADDLGSRVSLSVLFSPRINPAFQGGGPEAPPLGDVLGIGGHFILRELARRGVVSNSHLYPMCFVPNKRVRALALRMGGSKKLEDDSIPNAEQARAIYDLVKQHLGLDRATFRGAFDIPLQLVAQNKDLAQRLTRIELPAEDPPQGESWQFGDHFTEN